MQDLDSTIPGGVYLCQVNEKISCGACCGLYNVSDPSEKNLYAILEKRTERYDNTPKEYDALDEFQAIIIEQESKTRPYPEFHHCPYIGLIGENRDRPGCLLHPLGKGNNNVDWRGLSHWGGFACASYFCPTCPQLPVRYKKALRASAANWYIFGLAVTETKMVETFFNSIENRTSGKISSEIFEQDTQLQEATADFFDLKATWPFRGEGFNATGNYFFKDDLYPRSEIDYNAFDSEISEFDEIFKALGTEFKNSSELKQGIKSISLHIEKVVNRIKKIAVD